MKPDEIKQIRMKLGLSQQDFAASLGVSFATVNRWENGKARPQKDRLVRLRAMTARSSDEASQIQSVPPAVPRLDLEGDPEAVKLVIDAYRLRNGHIFNKAFGLELSRVVPLPHQRIAVYEHLLPQNPLRFLLADDAGAGKTIMTGLYIREMINRGRATSVLILCPAGLTWNWQRELHYFFDLEFVVLTGSDFSRGDPIQDASQRLFILSIDTAAGPELRGRITDSSAYEFDLAVFDEAHKLAWSDPARSDSKTRRYLFAELMSRKTTHLLLLTATPHMGKPFPFFALWRLLDPDVFSTEDALHSFSHEKRRAYFLRRLKEEMIDYKGKPIYMPRLCQTLTFELTPQEQDFYEASSEYLRWSYRSSEKINRNAAAMVVAVLQRRLASSTFAMLESLRRRKWRILDDAAASPSHTSEPNLNQIITYFDMSTPDEGSPEAGREADEILDEAAMALIRPREAAQRIKEIERLDRIIELGEDIRSGHHEAKFQKLRELMESAEFQDEKLLVFTEHRDTLEYLRQRFEALGYTGQVACIHGAMDVAERERERCFFMPLETRRAQGVPDPDGPSARIMLATDAAGEGINLQFAWLMVNFDIPWNPARLEQRMGRLHRFGQQHPEVRIFNLVAADTREGEVLQTLLRKLEEVRRDLASDKVFDVVGQILQGASIRDLLRNALLEDTSDKACRSIESRLATQKLRAEVEAQRKHATDYGDVARRLGQLKTEIEVEHFNKLLPAFIQNFVSKAASRIGIRIEGDLTGAARLAPEGTDGQWLRDIVDRFPNGIPEYVSVRRDFPVQGMDPSRFSFLRPGDVLFDAMCEEVIRRFKDDVQRGAVLCDPSIDTPYYSAVYLCQIGEASGFEPSESNRRTHLFERRLIGLRWDENGMFKICPPNHLLALLPAPKSLLSKAGSLLRNPDEQLILADGHAQMLADVDYLNQRRTALMAESTSRVEDLIRGFDFQAAKLAEERSALVRRIREGDDQLKPYLEALKQKQVQLEEERAKTLLYEQRRADLVKVVALERIATALVVPDPTPEAREAYDKNIEEIAVRIAKNYEMDHYKARVFDVSSPALARGYDLESHRGNGERVAIEVKGRRARGPVHLTENEWPTAANIREKYWLYVVVDCASNPRLYRVQDPAFKLAVQSRKSFTVNIGDVIRAAEPD
jgi:superfamily II DNA or RNA helicase